MLASLNAFEYPDSYNRLDKSPDGEGINGRRKAGEGGSAEQGLYSVKRRIICNPCLRLVRAATSSLDISSTISHYRRSPRM